MTHYLLLMIATVAIPSPERWHVDDDGAALQSTEAPAAHADEFKRRVAEMRALRNKDAAIMKVDELIKDFPSEAGAYEWAGIIYAWAYRRDQAVALYDRAIALQPSPGAYLNRSLIRPKQQLTARKADIDAALELASEQAQGAILAEQARLTYASGDTAKAVDDFTKAIAVFAEDDSLLVERAIAYQKLGEGEKADKDFAAARVGMTDASELTTACRLKANAAIELQAALDDCTKAAAQEPGNATHFANRGTVLLRLSRWDDAIRDYDAALQRDPRHPSAHYGRHLARLQKGDAATAAEDRTKALAIDPYVEGDFAYVGLLPGQLRQPLNISAPLQ